MTEEEKETKYNFQTRQRSEIKGAGETGKEKELKATTTVTNIFALLSYIVS